jgi:DNA polymerase-3 subunit beta
MIIFSKETLREALQGLRVLKLSKQSMPVLRQVLVFGYETLVEFSGTDLDQFLRYEGVGLSSNGTRVLVPYEQLQDVAKTADTGSEIQIHDGESALIRYHASGAVLEVPFTPVALDEFPPQPTADGEPIALPVGVLASMEEAMGCASEDTTRYILNGVYLDHHAVVATDGRQLYRRNSLELPVPQGSIFPTSLVLGVLPHDEAAHLWLWSRGEHPLAQITAGKWRWVTKLIEGKFPNYQQVIPQMDNYGGLVRISEADAARILSVVPKLPGFKDKESKVVLSVTDKGAVLRTAPNLPKVHLALDRSEVVRTASSDVAFNAKYLLGALQRGMRELHARDHVSALVMTDANRIHLWMPLRDVVTPPAESTPVPVVDPVSVSTATVRALSPIDNAPSGPSGENPAQVVSAEPAMQVSAASEPVSPTNRFNPQPNVSTSTRLENNTTMVAPINTPNVNESASRDVAGNNPVVTTVPRIVLPEQPPVSASDALQAKLSKTRDLLRDLGNELGGIQNLIRDSARQYKALERDHENLKKNIRALREVPV